MNRRERFDKFVKSEYQAGEKAALVEELGRRIIHDKRLCEAKKRFVRESLRREAKKVFWKDLSESWDSGDFLSRLMIRSIGWMLQSLSVRSIQSIEKTGEEIVVVGPNNKRRILN